MYRTNKILNLNFFAQPPRRIVNQVVLKNEQAVKESIAPGHFAAALYFHERRELKGIQFQKPAMQFMEKFAPSFVFIYIYAHRKIICKRSDNRFCAGQIRRPTRERGT